MTEDDVAPSSSILEAIANFPIPKDISGARSWFGLVNQVVWAYAISPFMQPFRDLIKPNTKFLKHLQVLVSSEILKMHQLKERA